RFSSGVSSVHIHHSQPRRMEAGDPGLWTEVRSPTSLTIPKAGPIDAMACAVFDHMVGHVEAGKNGTQRQGGVLREIIPHFREQLSELIDVIQLRSVC